MIGRRKFLLNSAMVPCTMPSIINKLKNLKSEIQLLDKDFSVISNASLRNRAAAKGLIYGAFGQAGYNTISQKNLEFRSALINECSLLVGGFYWSNTQPNVSAFDFNETDAFAQFALNNSMLFRGHPLVWDQLLPQWLTDKLEDHNTKSKEIENILINHISTIVRRYAGQMHSWDVVNEAVWPGDHQVGGLRKTPWLKLLGSNYIDIAFHAAREADPKALLVYNDYDLEGNDEKMSVATLNLLEGLVARGTPIDALGIQSHLFAESQLHSKRLRGFLRDVASLGLKILITELDVNDKKLPIDTDIVVRDRIVAATYEDYLNIVLNEPSVIAVITWGLSDRYSWLTKAVRPLPLDANCKRKLAWNAIARAIDNAPVRSKPLLR